MPYSDVRLAYRGNMAVQLAGTRQLEAGQQPATPAAWALAILITAPVLTHRRFPLASLAVCLAALVASSASSWPGWRR